MALFQDLGQLIRRNGRTLGISGGITIAVLIIVALFFNARMKDAEFCDSCHYMEPYVRHWKTSSHAEVTCVKCHDYGPGWLAVSAFKYATGAYSMRPKANVHDESCLASGCHDLGMLEGRTTYQKGIQFEHTVHLGQMVRGEQLRCTSCHNQIVQYNEEITAGHMAVNNKSCFVCHFKDAGKGEAITGCETCHGMPTQTVEHAGFSFDHGPYLKLGVACKQCHTSIVKGDGAVPESKCYSCHIERQRSEYTKEQLHNIHITENGIDCFQCHSDIEHGNFEMVSSLETRCEDCHLRQHNQPRQMYMGIGGRDTLDLPSDMFAAQVACVGCHTHVTPQGEPLAHQEKKEAQRASCVTCHGDGYDRMFDNWLEGAKKVTAEYGSYLKAVKSDFASAGGDRKNRTAAQAAISDAEFNYNFVREGHLPHNIRYGLYLLNSSAERVTGAMRTLKPGYTGPDRGSSLKPENGCLTFCHGLNLKETVIFEGKDLPHKSHATELEVSCAACHSITEHGKTQVDKTVCAGCHE